MEATRSQAGGDRERRERLESLQVELREAKAALAMARADGEPASVAALEHAVERASARRAEVEAAHQALVHEEEQLARDAKWLETEIDQEHTLRRGARLRDRYVEWADVTSRDGLPTSSGAVLGVIFVLAVMMTVLLLGGRC